VTLGASLVEKTSRSTAPRSVEHIMSLEPAQMAEFIKAIRNLETALGSPRRVMHAEEIKKAEANRRSMYLKRRRRLVPHCRMSPSTFAVRDSVSVRRCSTPLRDRR